MADLEHNDDLIGDFFRNKADEYDIPYNESDWQDLEKRLDRMDEKYAQRRRWSWAAAAAILIVSLLGYFTYENYIGIRNINQNIVGGRMQKESPSSPRNLPSETEQSRSEKTVSQKDNDRTNLRSSERSSGLAHHPNESAQKLGRANNAWTTTIATNHRANIPALICSSCELAKLAKEQNQIVLSANPKRKKKVNLQKALADNYGEQSTTGKRITRPSFSRLSIGFVMSPDLSTAGSLSHFSDPGYKLGITAEYNISPDFGISAGVIKSKVHYIAHQRSYHPPSGFWTNGIMPYETDGKCLLLDIPISLNYNFVHLEHSSFYIKGGISSYIMLNEAYNFDYSRNSNGLVQGWSDNTGTSYWMSNASFSVGYEWDVLPGLSLRAEPYIRIPVRGVGWANVKLYSVGSFISLNYKFW